MEHKNNPCGMPLFTSVHDEFHLPLQLFVSYLSKMILSIQVRLQLFPMLSVYL